MRIGVFGGTFDPIHKGHLEVAEMAFTLCSLEQIIFIPAKVPPHKEPPQASFEDRLNMVVLACQDKPAYICSAIEGERQGPSYSLHTIRRLKEEVAAADELFFIVGLDTFLEIHSWYEYQEVISTIHFIVIGREGYQGQALNQVLQEEGYIRRKNRVWENEKKRKLYLMEHSPVGISSTQLRENMNKTEQAVRFLPSTVLNYIKKNKLYGCN